VPIDERSFFLSPKVPTHLEFLVTEVTEVAPGQAMSRTLSQGGSQTLQPALLIPEGIHVFCPK
jgi:hypothetical protein